MSNEWPEAEQGMIMTKNQTGYMFTTLSGASPLFVEATKNCHGTIVDLACAYGVATLAALKVSDAKIIAIDLGQEHLDILEKAIPDQDRNRVVLQQQHFPGDFNLAPNSVDLLHCSLMLLFLTAEEIVTGLAKLFQVLKPGGHVFINMVSPYTHAFSDTILGQYEAQQAEGNRFPGLLDVNKVLARDADLAEEAAPNFIHLFKVEDFTVLLEDAGFVLEQSFYFDLDAAESFKGDGKGQCAFVARKPLA